MNTLTSGGVTFDTSHNGRIITIELHESRLNVLSNNVRRDLFACVERAERSDAVAVILRSASRTAFSVGSNIKEFPADGIGGLAKIRFEQHLLNRLERLPQIVIAALDGLVLGGGAELMLACDLRIATQSCRVGFPEITLGALPAAGGMKRLVRDIGAARATQLVCLGSQVDAQSALHMGLVNEIVPDNELFPRVESIAAQLLALPHDALRLAKSCIKRCLPATDADTAEAETFYRLFEGENLREGLAAFVEKRDPDFNKTAAPVRK